MIKRQDKAMAFKIDIAIYMAEVHGKLAAARFLDRHQVPLDVAMRILGNVSGSTRPLIRAQSFANQQSR